MNNFIKMLFIVMIGFTLTGCAVLLAGAAGGAGTAVWLSGKLSQEFHYPYEQTVGATKTSLKSLKLEIIKETRENDILQLRSKYTDGKEIWIDIRKVAKNSTKVEVRVGIVSPDKEASAKILKTIQNYL